MNRRDFLRRSAGTMAGTLTLPGLAAGAAPGKPVAATVVTLGKTGIKTSLLGMGTGMHGWDHESDLTRKGPEVTRGVFQHAWDRGLRYFDLADMYGSHKYMKELMHNGAKREEAMILTKAHSRDPEIVRKDLDRFRQELDTDYVDIVLIHCLSDRDLPNWTEKLRPCMDVLAEAKEKGIIRAHGCSCHNLDTLKEAAACDWVEVMLSRINPFGAKMDGTPEEVVPVLKQAHAAGKGMLGMKIVGEGTLTDKIPESMKFVLGLGCIHAMTIGFLSIEEIDGAIAHLDAAAAEA
ncbi:MAG: aldo/keto reductase [Candidatus Hydrogenedentes bacterium]|nr:aldo/keto reductase [Candidatus Hydrogenedentota bacterium]